MSEASTGTRAAATADATGAGAWMLDRGATVLADGGVRFAVWAPTATRVAVRLHEGGTTVDHPLERDGQGVFAATVAAARAGTSYQFVLDGDRALPTR